MADAGASAPAADANARNTVGAATAAMRASARPQSARLSDQVLLCPDGGTLRSSEELGSVEAATIAPNGAIYVVEQVDPPLGRDDLGTLLRVRDLSGLTGWVTRGDFEMRPISSAEDAKLLWTAATIAINDVRSQALATGSDARDWEIRNELAAAEDLRRTASAAADEALAVREQVMRESAELQLELDIASRARTQDDRSFYDKMQILQTEVRNNRESISRDVFKAAELRKQAFLEHEAAASASREARAAAREARQACQAALAERGEVESAMEKLMLDLREVDAAGAAARAFEQAEDLRLRRRFEEESQTSMDAQREVERLRRELRDLTRLQRYRPQPSSQPPLDVKPLHFAFER